MNHFLAKFKYWIESDWVSLTTGTGGGDVSLVGSYVVVGVGGDGAGVIGSIGFGFNDDTSCMKFFNRANYKDIELCLAATR